MNADQDLNKDKYFREMSWLALPFNDPRMIPAAKHFKVVGLPRLVVLNAKTGALINSDAVHVVVEQGPLVLEEWIE